MDPGGELGGSARGTGHHEGAVLYRETKSSPHPIAIDEKAAQKT